MAEPTPAAASSGAAPSGTPAHGVDLKNRIVAGLLAAAVPGLGHVYQGRVFKGAIYATCILGLFLSGQALGGWRAVSVETAAPGVPLGADDFDRARDPTVNPFGPRSRRPIQPFTAQVFNGVVAWPAIVQARRFYDEGNRPSQTLGEPLDAAFAGTLVTDPDGGATAVARLEGRLTLEPRGAGMGVSGAFVGRASPPRGGPAVEVTIPADRLRIFDRPVDGEPGRVIKVRVEPDAVPPAVLPDGFAPSDLRDPQLVGAVPRSFANWYLAPLDRRAANRLHAGLGNWMDLALACTMIAGLLNVLAFWDAVEGPAYGIGTEPTGDAGPSA